nr:hypothetical protein CFP56_58832 [Quercus suber]
MVTLVFEMEPRAPLFERCAPAYCNRVISGPLIALLDKVNTVAYPPCPPPTVTQCSTIRETITSRLRGGAMRDFRIAEDGYV